MSGLQRFDRRNGPKSRETAGSARRLFRVVVLVVAVAVLTPQAALAKGPKRTTLSHLAPGKQTSLRERVPINYVFVGFERGDVKTSAFLKGLPRSYSPIIRSKQWYDPQAKPTFGINYGYNHKTVFASRSYENRFFKRLAATGKKADPTAYQVLYNEQQKNVLDIDKTLEINGPATERWLAYHPPRGVNTRQNTLYFINWHGRKDFRFHVYSKTDEAITDTGVIRGVSDLYRNIAWGGTTPDDPENGLGRLARVWFMDLSAGPDAWSENWNVDTPDLDANGVENYRIPPSWEYSNKGYRKRSALSGDLAKVARYVAINLLFTPSPIYPAALTPPVLPTDSDLDTNFYEGQNGVDASEDHLKPKVLAALIEDLLPFGNVSADTQDLDLEDPEHTRCFGPWIAPVFPPVVPQGSSCYPDRPYNLYANMFLYNAINLDERVDDGKKVDYEAGSFNYAMPDSENNLLSCLAWADDNYTDGTQSFIFSFLDPSCLQSIGFTDLLAHEYGHHFSLSHPHDGYDSERNLEYSAYEDKMWFASLGDEVNSVMSYQSFGTNNEFSQFERDNINRWLTAAFLNEANKILGKVSKSSRSGSVRGQLKLADKLAGKAARAFAGHQYRTSVGAARRSYRQLRATAAKLGIKLNPDLRGTTALEAGQVPDPRESASRYAYVDVLDAEAPGFYVRELLPQH